MNIIEKYEVAGKSFNTKEEATEYEEKLRNNLPLRARNIKLFYKFMLGWPGEVTALRIVTNFCLNNKFTFGKFKGRCIGEIIILHPQYITWCLENIPWFSLKEREKILYEAPNNFYLGGLTWDVMTDEVTIKDPERYNNDLIDWEISQCQENEL